MKVGAGDESVKSSFLTGSAQMMPKMEKNQEVIQGSYFEIWQQLK